MLSLSSRCHRYTDTRLFMILQILSQNRLIPHTRHGPETTINCPYSAILSKYSFFIAVSSFLSTIFSYNLYFFIINSDNILRQAYFSYRSTQFYLLSCDLYFCFHNKKEENFHFTGVLFS